MSQVAGEKSGARVAPPEDLGADLIWEAEAIAQAIGQTLRQTNYLLESGRLPAKKIGRRWCASRSGLRNFFATVLNGEVA